VCLTGYLVLCVATQYPPNEKHSIFGANDKSLPFLSCFVPTPNYQLLGLASRFSLPPSLTLDSRCFVPLLPLPGGLWSTPPEGTSLFLYMFELWRGKEGNLDEITEFWTVGFIS
jgi:hypothetical protein